MGLGDKPVPGLAGGLDNLVVGLEDAVGEPGLAQVLPDVLDRVQLRGAGRKQDQGDVSCDCEGLCCLPGGSCEVQYGVIASCVVTCDHFLW